MAQKPARARPQKASVEAILDAAERLFGEHGLEGVSLRQIGTEAGSSNHFAVQYHFGDKLRLVRAIFERRLPALEVRRAQLLAEAKRAGEMDVPRRLMDVMLRPIAEERDSAGRRSYAAFLLGLRNFHGVSHSLRMESEDLAPLTGHVRDLLASSIPHLPEPLVSTRLVAGSTIFLCTLVDLDRRDATVRAPAEALLLDHAIDMAAAAMTAPVSDELRAAFETDR
jgi:AcrR family transcriptional regulator